MYLYFPETQKFELKKEFDDNTFILLNPVYMLYITDSVKVDPVPTLVSKQKLKLGPTLKNNMDPDPTQLLKYNLNIKVYIIVIYVFY